VTIVIRAWQRLHTSYLKSGEMNVVILLNCRIDIQYHKDEFHSLTLRKPKYYDECALVNLLLDHLLSLE